MKVPNLFVVGKPKSGTTAIHYLLAQHPEIYMSPFKEPLFFCKDIIQEISSYRQGKTYFPYKEKSDYLSLFQAADNEKIIGESSPQYLYSKVAADKIYNFNPDSKIIIILREPIDFLYSLYSHLIADGGEDITDFETAIALEKQRKEGKHIPCGCCYPGRVFYSERVKYLEQVKRYFKVFDKSKVGIYIYEDFRENNKIFYKAVLEFLEVRTNFVPDFAKVNVNAKPRSTKLNLLVRRDSLLKKAVQRCVSPEFYKNIQLAAKKILLKKTARKPLASRLRSELMQKYKFEVVELSNFLNVDLVKKWGYDKIPHLIG